MLGVYKKILSYVPKEKYLAYIGIILSMASVVLKVFATYSYNSIIYFIKP